LFGPRSAQLRRASIRGIAVIAMSLLIFPVPSSPRVALRAEAATPPPQNLEDEGKSGRRERFRWRLQPRYRSCNSRPTVS